MMKYFLLIFCIPMFAIAGYAQVDSTANAETLYSIAREKAFSGQWDTARILCWQALNKSPDYYEIEVFIGKTYAWEGKKDEARKIYKAVLAKSPVNIEAILAMADVEIWDEKPMEALVYLNQTLAVFPNNDELLVKKAKALIATQNEQEALLILSRAIELNPGNKTAIQLKQNLKGKKFKHTFFATVAGDFYSQYFDPMYYSSVQFGTVTKAGALIGRVNYAHRFQENGIQPEIDFYPTLWKGAYLFLNYGYTNSPLFSKHRIGAELFQSLPKNAEVSAGVRYLSFASAPDISIYTASLGWYIKSYWLNLRTYITPNQRTISPSVNLNARKYFADANNYVGGYVGMGFSPDTRRVQTNEGFDTGNNIYLLKAQKAGLIIQKSVRYNMYIYGEVYYAHQELGFSYGNYVHVGGFTTGLRIRL